MSCPIFSFSVLSDLHFMAYKEPETPVEWVPFLQREIEYISSLSPAFIVCNGDLTNGKERDYRLAMDAFGKCPMPVYYTMGNHEYYGCYEESGFTAKKAQERFLRMTRMPDLYYKQVIGGIRFLFLSTEHYTPDSNEAGWLTNEQLDWFEMQLAAARERAVFVFLHHPVNGTVANSDGTLLASDHVLNLLKQHANVVLFSGHTHCRMDREDQFVRRDSAVFVGGGCMYQEEPQSRWVDVYEDRAVIRLLCHRERRWLSDFERTVHLPVRL